MSKRASTRADAIIVAATASWAQSAVSHTPAARTTLKVTGSPPLAMTTREFRFRRTRRGVVRRGLPTGRKEARTRAVSGPKSKEETPKEGCSIVRGAAPVAGPFCVGRTLLPASAATVLRLVKALPMSTLEAPRRIGVDDWALRKGCTYGTIIVDLERWLQTARQVCHKAMRRRSRPELRRSGSALGSADWCAGRGA